MAVVPDGSVVAAALVVTATLLFGLTGPEAAGLGDGTASIEVAAPAGDRLAFDRGRFGAAASYLRLPDLVAHAGNVTGRPQLVYTVRFPELDVDRRETRLLRAEGRVQVHMSDRAYPPRNSTFDDHPAPGTYTGHLTVRVQSFSTDRTVINRTVTVRVPE